MRVLLKEDNEYGPGDSPGKEVNSPGNLFNLRPERKHWRQTPFCAAAKHQRRNIMMMLRFWKRSVVASLSLAAAAVFLSAASAQADPLILKFGHADNERAVFHTGALKFKEELERLSKGKILVQIFPNAQLGTVREVFESLQMGTVDVTASVSSVIANFVPEVSVYDLPCLLDNYEHAYRTLDGKVGERLNKQLRANGVEPLGWWQIGFRNVTSNKDIKTLEDFKGVRIRIMASNIFRDMFLQLGVDPVPMDWGELFTALQQGTVDGQENPYTQILDTNFYEVQKYLVETEHAYSPALFSMSAITWANLTPEQQAAVREAAKSATATARQATEDRVKSAKTELVEKHGMQFRALDKKVLQTKLRPVYEKYPNLMPLAEICDSYRR
jgi:tripartite ATP-independent transporter DctP family solute receptor